MITVYIKPNSLFTNPARWFVGFLAQHLQAKLSTTDKDTERVLKITDEADSDVCLSHRFYENLDKKIFNHTVHFAKEPLIRAENGRIDYVATIFYMVNCLQEYSVGNEDLDKYNRFRYEKSYQAKFGIIQENKVSDLIEEFVRDTPILRGVFLGKTRRPSQIFLTHDIDTLYASFVQDGFWAIKRGRLDILCRLIINELLKKPAYFNIDKILKIHSEYDLKSTFFWIVTQGRSEDGIKNADYKLQNQRVQQALMNIQKGGFEAGLHKSSLDLSFETEFSHLPNQHVKANRYHFLRFQLPQAWQTMSDSGVRLDASLGFAECYGFRNNYGLPFQPYDFRTGETMSLVVTPLNVMDGTLSYYMKVPEAKITEHILDFFEKNKENSVLSLLWHNTEFSEFRFKPYLKVYKEILKYIVETKIQTVTTRDILASFGH
ncbi:MAG: hypothetical protein JNL70_08040 [Saprospiraceae bacterium]|nr:hypothetical protein [Saprospiraceae bacterium]